MGFVSVRDADHNCDACELVGEDGVGGHRQELSIVAVSTRTRFFGLCGPSGRARVRVCRFVRLGEGVRGVVA
jgi:hypothetical protein